MRKLILKNPISLLVIINVIAFWLLHMYVADDSYTVLYTGAAVLIISLITYASIYFGGMGDVYLFPIVYLLVTLGVVMICRINLE